MRFLKSRPLNVVVFQIYRLSQLRIKFKRRSFSLFLEVLYVTQGLNSCFECLLRLCMLVLAT